MLTRNDVGVRRDLERAERPPWALVEADLHFAIGGAHELDRAERGRGLDRRPIHRPPGGLYGAPYNLTADDQYVGWAFTLGSETRTITGYVMATETLTITPPLSAAPAVDALFWVNDGKWFESAWMQDFVTAAWGYAKDIASALDATTRAKLDALFDWKARSVVGRFGSSAGNEFLYRDGAPYTLSIAPSDKPDFDGGKGPWYSNFGQVYEATFAGKTPLAGGGKPPPYTSPGPRVDGPLRMDLSPEAYLANAMPAIAYAVKHGAAGALAAYQRLTAASNWNEFVRGFDRQPVWAVSPGALPPAVSNALPAWRAGQAVNEWREIPGSAMALSVPSNVARQTNGVKAAVGPVSRLNAWCGLSIDTRSSSVWSLANGGHGDYFGNEVLKIDLMADRPAWVEWFAGSSGDVVDAVTPGTDPSHARYKDGLPCSVHSYYGQQFIERHNRAVRLGGSTAPIGSAFENVEAFDVTAVKGTNAWAAAGTYGFCLGGLNGGWTPAIAWGACKDPVTENLYVVIAPSVRRFTPSPTSVGGTWSVLGPLPRELNSGGMAATAVDTRRNRLLWIKGYGPNQPYTCDLASGAWTAQTHPPSEAKTALDALKPSLGMVYVPQLDAFLVRANAAGGQVLKIDAGTFVVSWLVSSGGDGVAQAQELSREENIYNRWLYVPALQGVVYFARSENNAWFLRLY